MTRKPICTGLEKVLTLITTATAAGLIYKVQPDVQYFRFDVRYGAVTYGIWAKADVPSVRRLVELARTQAPGFGKSLLGLVTSRTTLAEFEQGAACINWAYSRRKVNLITLANWLDEQGET